MATIINNPGDSRPVVEDGSGVGVVVGLIIAVILVILFFLFAWPAIQGNTAATPSTSNPGVNVNVTLPSSSASPSTQ